MGKKKEKVYVLECTKQQLELISESVEHYSRLLAGQIDEIYPPRLKFRKTKQQINIDAVRSLTFLLKQNIFPELHEHASYGVGNREIPIINDLYDIYKEINHFIYIQSGSTDYSVNSHGSLGYSKLPKIKLMEKK